MDIDALADQIVQRMKEEHHTIWLDPEIHATQHEFLALLIKEREAKILADQKKEERRKNMEDKIAGSLILSFLLVVLGLIGSGAMDWLRAHLK